MQECTFCRIVQGSLPAYKTYEDDDTVAFLDINPIRRGHTLIVPRKHYENFLDIPRQALDNLIEIAQRLAPCIMQATDADSFTLIGNNGASAGQVIFHTHLHIVPRRAGEPRARFSETFSWGQGREGDPNLALTAEAIRRKLNELT